MSDATEVKKLKSNYLQSSALHNASCPFAYKTIILSGAELSTPQFVHLPGLGLLLCAVTVSSSGHANKKYKSNPGLCMARLQARLKRKQANSGWFFTSKIMHMICGLENHLRWVLDKEFFLCSLHGQVTGIFGGDPRCTKFPLTNE